MDVGAGSWHKLSGSKTQCPETWYFSTFWGKKHPFFVGSNSQPPDLGFRRSRLQKTFLRKNNYIFLLFFWKYWFLFSLSCFLKILIFALIFHHIPFIICKGNINENQQNCENPPQNRKEEVRNSVWRWIFKFGKKNIANWPLNIAFPARNRCRHEKWKKWHAGCAKNDT